MKIYLFMSNELLIFKVPNKISGSFSFDYNDEEDSKLINIEVKEDKCFLCSKDDVKIMIGNIIHDCIELQDNTFYSLIRNNVQYLVYASNLDFNKLNIYSYDMNVNLNIGYSSESNLKYNCPYVINKNINISFKENKLILDNPNEVVIYVNKKYVTLKKIEIPFGSEIFIYGLNIIVLKGVLLITNNQNLELDMSSANIFNFNLPRFENPENLNIKDIDLYTSDDYFSKSPRLKRVIETKKITLAEFPQTEQNKTPLIITFGPMLTMGLVSIVNFSSTISKIQRGETTFAESKMEILTQATMLASMLLWPVIIHIYNSLKTKISTRKIKKKYKKYLQSKRQMLEEEKKLQKSILEENLISVQNCEKIALNKKFNFWDKRLDQSDLLDVRVGVGSEKLSVEISYPIREFSVEETEFQTVIEKLVNDFQYIENVPIKYSFSKNKITAIMCPDDLYHKIISNILLQLMSFYSYEDLKIVTFTSEKNKEKLDYLKYFNHSFSNDKSIRYFATNNEQSKNICEILNVELSKRIEESKDKKVFSPYYFIIIDDYAMVKRLDFIKRITEMEENLGFSIVIMESKMSKLPSKCNNFISLSQGESSILIDAFEKQKIKKFKYEFNDSVDMYNIARSLSNVPIEFAEGIKKLPESITFLEMERIGKVEQLNILNRWEKNDATQSLKAEIGVDEQGELLYLDLHEKFHGPHGLVAGTTGSGKSEFIITYILSLALNYSPEDVSFILIDYKGGGLAFAFENKLTGVTLPHLAGTITNLDKAEMNRTLISIDSEVKRRQRVFNQARDKCGESTIDIYKYQKLYKEGKLDMPVPHLFIICDEFAELKSQQPEFMDNLISIARIGRSLGVHLILATQKPSGVVDDQIWSNSKFKVCLKVQDASDSMEMLKKPDAAMIKQAGRFYLQVGMDEIFLQGQSGWCGAKYYPSDKILKQVDKSVVFIDNIGSTIKSIQNENDKKVIEPQGEQLAAILNNIIYISNQTNKKTQKLWLDNIPDIILCDDLYEKYHYTRENNLFDIIIGEYDSPETQNQGVETYNLLKDGNLVLYGSDGSEKEFFISSFIYSLTKLHTPEDINLYIVDYGSESLTKYKKLPHVGDMVLVGENEKYQNLVKMIKEEMIVRKKLFSDYGGQYSNYINNSGKKLPIKIFIINNFDSLLEEHQEIYDVYPELMRDSDRYGIMFVFTSTAINSIPSKIAQNFSRSIAFKLKESSDYYSIFDIQNNITLKKSLGRAIVKHTGLHEFQTLSIIEKNSELSKYMIGYVEQQKKLYSVKAPAIPKLPQIITFDHIKNYINSLNDVPLGIYRKELSVAQYDFLANIGTIISSNKAVNTITFVQDLISVFSTYNMNTIVIDAQKKLKINSNNKVNYYDNDFDLVFEKVLQYVRSIVENKTETSGVILIFGIDKLLSKISDPYCLEELATLLKQHEKISMIIVDDAVKIKNYSYENWFTTLFSATDGIWIGKGVSDQSLFQMNTFDKTFQTEIANNMGYIISEGYFSLVKFIELNKSAGEKYLKNNIDEVDNEK